MASFICKICDTDCETERGLKKHARKVHDCSIFMAMSPNLADKMPPKILKCLKLNDESNKHLDPKDRYVVLYNGTWEPINKLSPEEQEQARSIAVEPTEENKKPVKVQVTPEGSTMTDGRDPESLVTVIEPEKKNTRVSVGAMHVSYSQIAKYLSCEQAWKFNYLDELAPRVDNPRLQKGTLVHKAFEMAWYAVHGVKDKKEALKAARKAMKKAVIEALDKYIDNNKLLQEEIDLAGETAQEALNVARKQFPILYKKFEPVDIGGLPAVEYSFKFPIKKTAVYHGTIDLIAKERKTKQVLIIDYKTRSAFQPDSSQEFNLQNSSYQKALLDMGIKTVGSMTYEVWHEAPKQPEVLKSGKAMSKQLIRTDWKTYEAALIENGFDPDEYQDMKAKLADVEWNRENRAYRNEAEINNTWDTVILPAIERMAKDRKAFYNSKFQPIRHLTTLNTGCPSCEFQKLCMEPLRGRDEEALAFIRKEEFKRNEYLDKYLEV